MYNNFTKADRRGNVNVGSCEKLTNYLEKETVGQFFNNRSRDFSYEYVTKTIDKNGRGQLGKKDWKFVEIEYAPSPKEQQKLIEIVTGKKLIPDWNMLSFQEQQEVKKEFVNYVIAAQNLQASKYKRKGINNGDDLLWFGKIETQRTYKGYDEEVKIGIKNQGDPKPGLNLHCHIIQSRKSRDKKTKLSPLTNYKEECKENKVKQGFNRNEFKTELEDLFDKTYNYKRELNEKVEYSIAVKKNDLIKMRELEFEKMLNEVEIIEIKPDSEVSIEQQKKLKSRSSTEEENIQLKNDKRKGRSW